MNSSPDAGFPIDAAAEAALTVTCRPEREEIHAVVHDAADPGRVYADLHMAVFPGGLALMESDARGTIESLERLGERIVREKEQYLEIKKLDEALFGADYEAA